MAEFFKWYKELNKNSYYIFIGKGRPTSENTIKGWRATEMGAIQFKDVWNTDLFRNKSDKEHKKGYKVSTPKFALSPRRTIIKDLFDLEEMGQL